MLVSRGSGCLQNVHSGISFQGSLFQELYLWFYVYLLITVYLLFIYDLGYLSMQSWWIPRKALYSIQEELCFKKYQYFIELTYMSNMICMFT